MIQSVAQGKQEVYQVAITKHVVGVSRKGKGSVMVKRILKTVGAKMSVVDYRNAVIGICASNPFAFEKAIGSLGGASRWGIVSIVNGVVTRLK